MRHYKLTEKDMEICQRQNAKNGWGFTDSMCRYQLQKHRFAWNDIQKYGGVPGYENTVYKREREMAMVEERLTDANFHTFCNLLSKHDYKAANKWIREEMS